MLLPGSCREQWDRLWDSFSSGWGPAAVPNRLVLQTLYQFYYPSLDTLQDLKVIPELNAPEVDIGLKLWPHQCWAQANNSFHNPTGYTTADRSQDAIDSPGHRWLIFSQRVTSTPGPFPLGSFLAPLLLACSSAEGFIVAKVQDPAPGSREFSFLED